MCVHMSVQGSVGGLGVSVGQHEATALLPRAQGTLWGGHREGIGFTVRGQSPSP